MSEREDLSGIIDEAVRAKTLFIAKHRERYIEAWMAETGLLPSESMLVEQHCADGRTTVRIERRAPIERT